MAIPYLVTSDGAALKKHPGGVIAIRAKDFIVGSATVITDSLSISGTPVQELQQAASLAAASDTLHIPCSSIPIVTNMSYNILISYRLLGKWDVTNNATMAQTQWEGDYLASQLAVYGYDYAPNLASAHVLESGSYAKNPHYAIGSFESGFPNINYASLSDVIKIVAFGVTGTTHSWLLDHVWLIPFVNSGLHAGFNNNDFIWQAPSLFSYDSFSFDGPDGGDANGKYTKDERSDNTIVTSFDDGGGGDYQKKSSYAAAEYFGTFINDNFGQWDGSDGFASPPKVYLYTTGGPVYHPAETWVDDAFTRTVTAGWGRSPQGYAWTTTGDGITPNPTVAVNGSQGVISNYYNTTHTGAEAVLKRTAGTPGIIAGSFTLSGKVKIDVLPGVGPDLVGITHIFAGFRSYPGTINDLYLVLNPDTSIWNLYLGEYYQDVSLAADGTTGLGYFGTNQDISAWWGVNVFARWKVEVKRYKIRAKVWQDGTSEPGWQIDTYLPMVTNPPNEFNYRYPYTGGLGHIFLPGPYSPIVGASSPILTPTWNTYWDDIKVEYDPYGSPANGVYSVDDLNGSQRAQITVPYGSIHLIYWGQDYFTNAGDTNPGPGPSVKVWVDPGGAELELMEAYNFFMMRQHIGPISSYSMVPLH
jgi:hypothetical protein